MGLYRVARRLAPTAFLAFAFALGLPLAAQAALRTFVASTGNDANTATNCPVTNPCQSFAAAYSVTNANGEIIALDSAGYGPVTITTSVSIISIQRGFVKVNASSTGIAISGASTTVLLDGIEVTGSGNASSTGISVSGGAHLILKNSTLVRLATGMSISSSKADIVDSDINLNTIGISTTGSGVDPNNFTGGGTTQARISAGNVMGNGTAFFMNSPGTVGGSTANLVTILIRIQDNSSAAIVTNIVGNTTVTSGSGGSCNTGGNCTSAITYQSGVNFNVP
jgi:hypothetical protein